MTAPRIILASASPRRRELLAQLGVTFEVASAEIDETPHPGETAEALVARLAIAKARAAQEKTSPRSLRDRPPSEKGAFGAEASLRDRRPSEQGAFGASEQGAARSGESPALEVDHPLSQRGSRERSERGGILPVGELFLGSDTEVELDGRIYGKPGDEAAGVEMLLSLAGRTHRVWSAVALVQGGLEDVRVNRSEVRFRAISPAEARAYWASGEPRDKAGGYAIQGLGAVFISHLAGSYSGVMGLPLFETAALLHEFGVTVLAPRQS